MLDEDDDDQDEEETEMPIPLRSLEIKPKMPRVKGRAQWRRIEKENDEALEEAYAEAVQRTARLTEEALQGEATSTEDCPPPVGANTKRNRGRVRFCNT